MSRQLPVPVSESRSQLAPVNTSMPATLSRIALALAPDIIQFAERAATRRQARRQVTPPAPVAERPREGIRLSEVEVDLALPLVRRVTMRQAIAWNDAPEPPAPKQHGRLKKAGLVGASGVLAVAAGLLVRRVGPRLGERGEVIDVEGWQR